MHGAIIKIINAQQARLNSIYKKHQAKIAEK